MVHLKQTRSTTSWEIERERERCILLCWVDFFSLPTRLMTTAYVPTPLLLTCRSHSTAPLHTEWAQCEMASVEESFFFATCLLRVVCHILHKHSCRESARVAVGNCAAPSVAFRREKLAEKVQKVFSDTGWKWFGRTSVGIVLTRKHFSLTVASSSPGF